MNDSMHIVDWLPTLITAAGGNKSDLKGPIDGLNLWNAIANGEMSSRNSMIVDIDNDRNSAIKGKFKLIKGDFLYYQTLKFQF